MCTARRTVLDKSSASDQGASLYSAVEDSAQDQEDKVKDQEDSVQDQEDRVKDQEGKSQDRIIQMMIMKIISHKRHQVL